MINHPENPLAVSLVSSAPWGSFPITVLLIDDQMIVAEAIRRMLGDQSDIQFHYCQDPAQAISMAEKISPTVVLQDIVMNDVNGLTIVKNFRANPATSEIPIIVLSTQEDPKIKAEAFAIGANDYIVKLPAKIELIARIRYHSAAYIRLLERNVAYEKLKESQKKISDDLADAAEYVKSILPKPLDDDLKANWKYIPSAQLGGDSFGYHWIDSDHFAIYLLDVCGHGVGASLLSITIITVLRSQTLLNVDFCEPTEVLRVLNETFTMEEHNNMFFTIWYGVYNKNTRRIDYATGGHPPAILVSGASKKTATTTELKASGIAIGAVSDAEFQKASVEVGAYNRLYVFSDGAYEIIHEDGKLYQLREFIDLLKDSLDGAEEDLDRIVHHVQALNHNQPLLDDFSFMRLVFN